MHAVIITDVIRTNKGVQITFSIDNKSRRTIIVPYLEGPHRADALAMPLHRIYHHANTDCYDMHCGECVAGQANELSNTEIMALMLAIKSATGQFFFTKEINEKA